MATIRVRDHYRCKPRRNVIYYTTDGSTPTSSSTQYTGPITVSQSGWVQAIAVAPGVPPSSVVSAYYSIYSATPVLSPNGGTFTSPQTASVTITDATPGAVIYYTTDESWPTTSSTQYTGPITVSQSEEIIAIAVAPGLTQGYARGLLLSKCSDTRPLSQRWERYTSVPTVTISDATAGAVVYYTTDGSWPTTSSNQYSGPFTVSQSEWIIAIAIAPGLTQSSGAEAYYSINLPTAATPIFSVPAGTYTSAQTVTISDTTPNAAIYYTTNGTVPTTSSTKYTAAITVSATETIEAIATASGYSVSTAATATYTIAQPPFGSLDWAGDQKNAASSIPVGDNLAVVGWAADVQDGAPVKQVQILIDGAAVGNASLGIARPDVAAAYGSKYANSGYSFVYASGYMSGGTHTISAVATDSLGLTTTLGTKTVTVANQPPFGSLDMAGDQVTGSSTIAAGRVLAVVGWAADTQQGAPVSQVQMLIDGDRGGQCRVGHRAARCRQRLRQQQVQQLRLELRLRRRLYERRLAYGHGHCHRLAGPDDDAGHEDHHGNQSAALRLVDMAGDQVTGSSSIAAGRVLAVIGWAADPQDGAPVKQVQVLIDGAVVGNAGLNQARPDVASAYGKPAYANSGWSFVYAAGYMSGGTHTVSAIAPGELHFKTSPKVC
jgi:hypothetical protein